ncbi:MAG: phenylacetate-CoA oxygenase subunit PaaI [Chloroflexi bacterium]|nr:phenylacetate-CoA oxygenase subunit PaaI [Chloroflexota bacterium]
MSQDTAFSVGSLPRGAQRALYNLITIVGDNKFRLGVRYAEYCNAAPTIEASIAAAAMAQDELGHTRNLFPLLREFEWARDEEEDGIARAHYRNLSFLDQSFEKWADFVSVNFLLDQAITTILASAHESRFTALKQRSRKMVVEERFHTLYGTGWFKSLAMAGGAARAELEGRTRALWDEVLCFFGPAGNAGLQVLKDEDVLDAGSEELRARFLERVSPTLTDVGFSMSGGELPWPLWDLQAWRLNRAT